MEYLIFIAAVGIVLFIIAIMGHIDRNKKNKKYIEQLRKAYGSFGKKEIRPEQYRQIEQYYRKHCEQKKEQYSEVDDITWNDLDMNRLFQLMDCTQSSAGQEYLYYSLRMVKNTKEELEEQEKLVLFFDSYEEERIQFQYICREIGKTGKYSIYDYLDYLDTLGKRSNLKHHLINFLFLPAIGTIFYNTGLGIFLLFLLICYNIASYFREKDVIAPYITSFLYVLRILNGIDRLNEIKSTELKSYMQPLVMERRQLRKFVRNSNFALSDLGTSSNPFSVIIDYLKMMFHIDIIMFNAMLGELIRHVDNVDHLITGIGTMETAIAIGNYRRALQYYCIPELSEEKKIYCKEIYHPYIENPVSNSLNADKNVLLTGSNASGKSTFLKTIALNAITAQTIHTVAAKAYQACIFKIYSSMSLRDDLMNGESYYMAEIRSLKRILGAIQEAEIPVLCFVDEVLRGTNTVERIAASTQILKSMVGKNVVCFAATHDIELTELLKHIYDNYHFTEDVINHDVLFNYQLQQGPATSRNAIKLLEMIGYDKEIITKANEQAEYFIKYGNWSI